nr:MAG TPA: Type II secretion system, protein M [Caudoviricetes sp.]
MYERIKSLFNRTRNRYILIGSIVCLALLCLGYIFYQPSGGHNNDSLNTVERIESQQRESVKLNRDIQSSIDRSSKLSHETKGRIERSAQYNIDIGNRIDESQNAIHEARSYLVRNAELIDRIERAIKQRQENNQATTHATQPIPGSGSGSDNRSSNSSMTER